MVPGMCVVDMDNRLRIIGVMYVGLSMFTSTWLVISVPNCKLT